MRATPQQEVAGCHPALGISRPEAASVTAASTATTRRQSRRQLGAKDGFDAEAIRLLQLLVLPDPAQLSLTSSPVATPLSGFRRQPSPSKTMLLPHRAQTAWRCPLSLWTDRLTAIWPFKKQDAPKNLRSHSMCPA